MADLIIIAGVGEGWWGGGIGRVGGLEMWKGETRVRRNQMGQKQMGRLLQQVGSCLTLDKASHLFGSQFPHL